ncbi:MAG: PorP/SprF family type IX secretion system membrane protein [Bacteroidia bacterium]
MKRFLYTLLLFVFLWQFAGAQQYPWLTQYRSNLSMFNPAFCGTKRILDFRMFYRNQWTGYDGAPKTYAAVLNLRYAKGRLGTGGFVYRDQIGPFVTTYAALTFAVHLRMEDIEISAGAQMNYVSQSFDGTKVTLHNQIDRGINQYVADKSHCYDASFGLVAYNDRFYFGFAANNLIGSTMTYYAGDPFYKGNFKNEGNYSVNVGYNYSENPLYVFENSLMALYTSGVPFYFDYTLRLHVRNKFFGCASIRLKDAVALGFGVTIQNNLQIAYSYDIVTSPLRQYQKGSHEISLVFSSNLGKDQKRRGGGLNGKFLHQKFQYLL